MRSAVLVLAIIQFADREISDPLIKKSGHHRFLWILERWERYFRPGSENDEEAISLDRGHFYWCRRYRDILERLLLIFLIF